MKAALLVFAKVPEPGRVKTRLSPPLTARQAADLYDAFLRDALDRYAAWGRERGVAVHLHLSSRSGADLEGALGDLPDGLEVREQRGDGLGDRMMRAFVEAFAAGFDRVVVVGTDHPTLPLAFFDLALEALDAPMTAAIGPSDDGGYYLLGLNDVAPALFDMEYSHARVFEDTLERVFEVGLEAVVLPPHYDVDDGSTLERLLGEWREGVAVGERTGRLLERLTEG